MCGFENSFSEKRFVFSSKNGHRVNDEDLMQIYMKQIAHRDIFYGSDCVCGLRYFYTVWPVKSVLKALLYFLEMTALAPTSHENSKAFPQ